jgi:alkylated DNA nucleotide flippase Atl1
VVRTDGRLAEDLPEGPDQQKNQLLREGVPFTPDGRVDFEEIPPKELE